MMRYLIVCLLMSSTTLAQTSFYNKKNSVELTGGMNCPILSGAFNTKNYYSVGDNIVARRDLLDWGGTISYNRIMSSKVSLGFSAGFRRFEVFSDRVFLSNFYSQLIGQFKLTTNYRVESAAVNSFSVIPTFSVASGGSVNGSGIENRFGVGYSRLNVQNKGYTYSLNNFESNEETWTNTDVYFLDANWPNIQVITIHYGISLKVPILDWLQWKIGSVNYVNIHFKPNFDSETNKVGLFDFETLFYNIQRENAFIWSLDTGLVVIF